MVKFRASFFVEDVHRILQRQGDGGGGGGNFAVCQGSLEKGLALFQGSLRWFLPRLAALAAKKAALVHIVYSMCLS